MLAFAGGACGLPTPAVQDRHNGEEPGQGTAYLSPQVPAEQIGGNVAVYAHSGAELYEVDPRTLAIRRIGRFFTTTSTGAREDVKDVTDIAIDKDGRMTGITFDQLLSIDPTTAECQRRTKVNAMVNGLSWIRLDDGGEALVATGKDGSVLRIDPETGDATSLGALGNGMKSSGDIVSVDKYGTLATLVDPKGRGDLLARLDPKTGAATVVGNTAFPQVWGLGFWGNRVFGFTKSGEFMLIEPKTGKSKLIAVDPIYEFWGAAVSTSAITID
ncbi:MAG TPA: hypothetical protein VGF45_18100 [Polyangia bacterium]